MSKIVRAFVFVAALSMVLGLSDFVQAGDLSGIIEKGRKMIQGGNPCGANPCAANPCGANPCAANPCGANPCGGWEVETGSFVNPCGVQVPINAPDMNPPLGPLGPPPIPADNPQTPAKIELGKKMFFEDRLTGDRSLSCGSCHDPKFAWTDGADVCKGYPGASHWRNCQTVVNTAYYSKLFWAGSSRSLESQGESANRGGVAGNGERDMMEARLYQVPEYKEAFREVYGDEWPLLKNAWRAIAAFERSMNDRDTAFDRFMKGDQSAISAQAKKGLEIFKGKGNCIECHNGPFLTDQKYYNLGVPDNPSFEEDPLKQITFRFENYAKGTREKFYRNTKFDLGLYFRANRVEDIQKFRTPALRGLIGTEPYMHNGVFFTLEEVIDFYNEGGGEDQAAKLTGVPTKTDLIQPLNLTDDEKAALIALLETTTNNLYNIALPQLPADAVYRKDLKWVGPAGGFK